MCNTLLRYSAMIFGCLIAPLAYLSALPPTGNYWKLKKDQNIVGKLLKPMLHKTIKRLMKTNETFTSINNRILTLEKQLDIDKEIGGLIPLVASTFDALKGEQKLLASAAEGSGKQLTKEQKKIVEAFRDERKDFVKRLAVLVRVFHGESKSQMDSLFYGTRSLYKEMDKSFSETTKSAWDTQNEYLESSEEDLKTVGGMDVATAKKAQKLMANIKKENQRLTANDRTLQLLSNEGRSSLSTGTADVSGNLRATNKRMLGSISQKIERDVEGSVNNQENATSEMVKRQTSKARYLEKDLERRIKQVNSDLNKWKNNFSSNVDSGEREYKSQLKKEKEKEKENLERESESLGSMTGIVNKINYNSKSIENGSHSTVDSISKYLNNENKDSKRKSSILLGSTVRQLERSIKETENGLQNINQKEKSRNKERETELQSTVIIMQNSKEDKNKKEEGIASGTKKNISSTESEIKDSLFKKYFELSENNQFIQNNVNNQLNNKGRNIELIINNEKKSLILLKGNITEEEKVIISKALENTSELSEEELRKFNDIKIRMKNGDLIFIGGIGFINNEIGEMNIRGFNESQVLRNLEKELHGDDIHFSTDISNLNGNITRMRKSERIKENELIRKGKFQGDKSIGILERMIHGVSSREGKQFNLSLDSLKEEEENSKRKLLDELSILLHGFSSADVDLKKIYEGMRTFASEESLGTEELRRLYGKIMRGGEKGATTLVNDISNSDQKELKKLGMLLKNGVNNSVTHLNTSVHSIGAHSKDVGSNIMDLENRNSQTLTMDEAFLQHVEDHIRKLFSTQKEGIYSLQSAYTNHTQWVSQQLQMMTTDTNHQGDELNQRLKISSIGTNKALNTLNHQISQLQSQVSNEMKDSIDNINAYSEHFRSIINRGNEDINSHYINEHKDEAMKVLEMEKSLESGEIEIERKISDDKNQVDLDSVSFAISLQQVIESADALGLTDEARDNFIKKRLMKATGISSSLYESLKYNLFNINNEYKEKLKEDIYNQLSFMHENTDNDLKRIERENEQLLKGELGISRSIQEKEIGYRETNDNIRNANKRSHIVNTVNGNDIRALSHVSYITQESLLDNIAKTKGVSHGRVGTVKDVMITFISLVESFMKETEKEFKSIRNSFLHLGLFSLNRNNNQMNSLSIIIEIIKSIESDFIEFLSNIQPTIEYIKDELESLKKQNNQLDKELNKFENEKNALTQNSVSRMKYRRIRENQSVSKWISNKDSTILKEFLEMQFVKMKE